MKQMSLPFIPKNSEDLLTEGDASESGAAFLDADLLHRVAVLEAWVRMVEGQVTGPMAALPTLDEASLRVQGGQ